MVYVAFNASFYLLGTLALVKILVFIHITSNISTRPISRKPEAFLNRRRPSSPSINEENDEMKTNVIANFEEVSTRKNI